MSREARVRVWVTDGPSGVYPERGHDLVSAPPLTGVCFSGGSTRSYAATYGQLRGLVETGLIDRVGYLSAVSGGAWAATPYAYGPEQRLHAAGADDARLGSHQAPENLSPDRLAELDPRSLGFAATGDFAQALASARADPSVPADEVWARAVAQTFLTPYGLYDPENPAGFTYDERTAADIRARNPELTNLRLHVLRGGRNRPLLLIHSTLNWPEDASKLEQAQRVGFEYSPLGVGSPTRVTLRYPDREPRTVGGGFVEPFGFGSGGPDRVVDPAEPVTVEVPRRPFTLAEAIGASSAFSTPDRDLRQYPHATYWSPGGGSTDTPPVTTREVFTDGGDLENYGLIPLLRRRVRAAIVFVNTLWPLQLDYDPDGWPDDLNDPYASRRAIDPFLAPLFGAPCHRFPHNRVFPEADYVTVISTLQDAKRRGGPVVAMTTHVVECNDWWGVEGGDEIRVCWVYNDHVERWLERLPTTLKRLVREGQSSPRSGPFANFPHYLTRGQNPDALIRLTPSQVNLLAHLSCWNVVECRDQFHDLFEG